MRGIFPAKLRDPTGHKSKPGRLLTIARIALPAARVSRYAAAHRGKERIIPIPNSYSHNHNTTL